MASRDAELIEILENSLADRPKQGLDVLWKLLALPLLLLGRSLF